MSTFSQKTLDKFKIVCYYGLVIKNDVRRIITASLLSTELSHSTSSRTGNNPRYCGLLPICMRSDHPAMGQHGLAPAGGRRFRPLLDQHPLYGGFQKPRVLRGGRRAGEKPARA